MDLSKTAKTRRDQVESPLWRIEKMLDQLEQTEIRIKATMAVYHETIRTLEPAEKMVSTAMHELTNLQDEVAALWEQGRKRKWKEPSQ